MRVFSLVYNNTAAGNHRILSEFGRNVAFFFLMGREWVEFYFLFVGLFVRWFVGLFLLQPICIQLIWNSKGSRT
jgi:hypothetical protein